MTDSVVEPLRILYITGVGRSGSTILEMLLAQLPGVIAIGETHYIVERGVFGGDRCSCGVSFQDCPFWQAVLSNLPYDARRDDLLHAESGLRHLRYAVKIHFGKRVLSPDLLENTYSQFLLHLYQSIKKVSGAGLIVDSSKIVPYGLFLSKLPGVEVRFLHLMRDPRAVSFSWRRRRVRPEVVGREQLMWQPSYFESSYVAAEWNLMSQLVEWAGYPYLRVRYEDLVQRPQAILEEIIAFAGFPMNHVDLENLEISRRDQIHSLSGNPVRFTPGKISLKLDDEWRSKMPWFGRLLVELFNWPFLLAYGYWKERPW